MSCNKRAYPNERIAEEALIQARIRFENNTAVSVYQCENCGSWHLSSAGNINSRLEEMIKSGELEKERKKDIWENKYKF